MLEGAISVEETLEYARRAKDHARDHIKKGSTQLENNNLEERYFDHLRTGIGERGTGVGVRTIGNQQAKEDWLERNKTVSSYESIIETTSKFSIGNCYELAVQALDYVLNYVHSDMNAEVYKIHGGDHVFLVLNRDPNSNPQDPETWGENAVICDPWSDKVYKASEYLTELKNFYRMGKKNYIEDFDPAQHLLLQIENFNTSYLRHRRTIPNLKASFLGESDHMIRILENYKAGLMEEEKRIRNKRGADDQKVLVLSEKIKHIDKAILSTRDVVNYSLNQTYHNDYREAKSELMKTIQLINENAVLAMQFSGEDRGKLFAHKGKGKASDAMKLFGVKTKTHTHLEELTKETNEELSRRR